MESEIIQAHLPCSDCGSSDGLTQYTDHTYCFVCEKWTATDSYPKVHGRKSHRKLGLLDNDSMEIKALRARGITKATCQLYGYGVSKDEWGNTIQVAPYIKDTEVIFQKTRDKDKNFLIRGKKDYIFFGQHLFTGGRKLVVTEGEIDCLTVSQVQGNKYPVVSIPFGCKSAAETFKSQLRWLDNFDEVVVMFDMDEVGQKAVETVGGILPPHKLKVAKLPLKDPNECLLANKPDSIIKAIWNAVEYQPDGIVNAKDYKEQLFAPEADIVSYDYPWGGCLTKMTQGIRKGEMLLLTAGTGIGKSTAAREIAYKLKMVDHLKIGLVMLEENPKKTLRDILSIHLQKPLHLMWNDKTKAMAMKEYDNVFGDGNFVLYDHFGSIESHNLLSRIRYLIVSECCDFVIFDHISIAVSGLEDTSGDERKCIDRLMTQLRSLVEETGAGLIIISHLRKSDTKSTPFEQGGTISLDDLRGSGTLKQLPDTILALERNQQADDDTDKNVMKVRVLKCRFTGSTGLADKIKFDKSIHRILDVDPMEIHEEEGENEECPF